MTPQEAIDRAVSLTCWSGDVTAAPLVGGITNHNILVHDQGKKYVVRLGQDIPEHMVMRWNELAISRAAQASGVAPAVVHSEPAVMVLEYIDSTPLAEADLNDAATLGCVVDLIKRAHVRIPNHLRGPVLSFSVFHILRDYAATLREHRSEHQARLGGLLEHAAALERAVGAVDLVLGHNDLLPANILRAGTQYWLIDWEYGGFNSPLFDLGGLASNCDLAPEAEAMMLQRYFGTAPDAALWRCYEAMKCASLLRDAMWSMVSETTSQIDFDYRAYTAGNLDRFERSFAQFSQQGNAS